MNSNTWLKRILLSIIGFVALAAVAVSINSIAKSKQPTPPPSTTANNDVGKPKVRVIQDPR